MVAYTKASGFSHRAARPHAHSSKIHAHQRGKPAARLHNAHTRPMLTWPIRKPGRQPGGCPRVHTAPRLHSPARSRGLTRYIDHPAPSSGPLRALPLLDGTLTRRRPKAIPRHLAHGTDPTQHDAPRLAAPPAPACAAARSMPTKRGKPAARPHSTHTRPTCSRGHQTPSVWLRSTTRAHRSTTPLPRAITGFDPL